MCVANPSWYRCNLIGCFLHCRWCGQKHVKLAVPLQSVQDFESTSTGSMVVVTLAAMMAPCTSWSASMELATLRIPSTCSTTSIPTELDHLAVTALPSTLSVSPTPSSALRFTAMMNWKSRETLLPSTVDYAVSGGHEQISSSLY